MPALRQDSPISPRLSDLLCNKSAVIRFKQPCRSDARGGGPALSPAHSRSGCRPTMLALSQLFRLALMAQLPELRDGGTTTTTVPIDSQCTTALSSPPLSPHNVPAAPDKELAKPIKIPQLDPGQHRGQGGGGPDIGPARGREDS